MSVKVRIPTILRTYTGGQSEVPAEGATLSEVIASLEQNHPGIGARVLDDQGKLRRFVNVYVNDDDVRFEGGLDAVTPDGAGCLDHSCRRRMADGGTTRAAVAVRPHGIHAMALSTANGGGHSAWLSAVQLGKSPQLPARSTYENAPCRDKK